MRLHTKIILLIVAVTLGAGLGSSLIASRMMHDALESELSDQAVVAVQSLAEYVTRYVIDGEIVEALEAVRKMVERSQSIQYAYIIDFEGRLFVHTFEGGFPRELAGKTFQHDPVSAQSPKMVHLKTDTGYVLDIACLLIEGMRARVHIGMSGERTHVRVTSLRNWIIGLSLLLAVVGITIGTLVSLRMTRPLADLAGAMHDFGTREGKEEIPFRSGGREMTHLTRAFNRMILDRKKAEEALGQSEERYRGVVEDTPVLICRFLPGGEITFVNKAYCKYFAKTSEELVGSNFLSLIPEADRQAVMANISELTVESPTQSHEHPVIAPDGDIRWQHWTNRALFDAQGKAVACQSLGEDITERKRAEEEKDKLQAQLIQAQKMESVGRLAGGVAHDFNNMLSVILGHTEMAMDMVDPTQPVFTNLQEIRKAAERSANITRQLLAFARRQTIAPKVLDLNATVEDMLKMIRRLIGEDIDLAWLPSAGLWPVKIDPAQIDQTLANLCLNARDAIEGVGKMIIETGNVAFNKAYCADHAGFVPGEYVLLAVSDDGCGMDKEILDKLFEPFFTTKGVGRGTGLGLATVYGIVKQNNGFINVYSEPGQGTTFKIYLSRHAGKAAQMQNERPAEPVRRGHETILLVEDEPAILEMTTIMLEGQGYTVLAASTPREAIRLAEAHSDEIHLLITDVVLPEMNGRDLAKNLLTYYPNLKHLFMSGYTANVIAHKGVLDKGVHFIQKPFVMLDLAPKIREALDSE